MDTKKRLHEELDEIFGDDRDRPITMEDMTKMKYLECCIKEGLRMYPSVPMLARSINSDLKLGKSVVPFSRYGSVFIV